MGPLVLPPKEGLFQSKQGSFGFIESSETFVPMLFFLQAGNS